MVPSPSLVVVAVVVVVVVVVVIPPLAPSLTIESRPVTTYASKERHSVARCKKRNVYKCVRNKLKEPLLSISFLHDKINSELFFFIRPNDFQRETENPPVAAQDPITFGVCVCVLFIILRGCGCHRRRQFSWLSSPSRRLCNYCRARRLDSIPPIRLQ